MSSGGELAFIALHGVVKLLDTVFWVFGKGLVATALAVVGFVARAILGEDARETDRAQGATGARRGRLRDEALSELLSLPPDRRVSEAARGDAKKLRDKHAAWCEWHVEHDVSTLLDREKPAFEIVKAFYPHAFHATTKQGFAVQLEKPGRFPRLLAELRDRGFADPTRVVVEHVSFVMSHAFDAIDARAFPGGRILRIVDMSRLDLSDTGYEAYTFLKVMAHVSSVAFPERVHKVVIVNPPAVFNALWGVFSHMVSARTMARVRICKDTQSARETLLEDLDLEDIPREYGGACDCGRRRRKLGEKYQESFFRARFRDCPAAACTSCWRDAPLERAFWDRARGGVAGLSGDRSARRDARRGREREKERRARRSDARRAEGATTRFETDANERSRAKANANASASASGFESKAEQAGSNVMSACRAPRRTPSSRGGSRRKPHSLASRAGDVETVRASAPLMFVTPRAKAPEPAAAADETAGGRGLGSWFF